MARGEFIQFLFWIFAAENKSRKSKFKFPKKKGYQKSIAIYNYFTLQRCMTKRFNASKGLVETLIIQKNILFSVRRFWRVLCPGFLISKDLIDFFWSLNEKSTK
jgi:hypothetical protein